MAAIFVRDDRRDLHERYSLFDLATMIGSECFVVRWYSCIVEGIRAGGCTSTDDR